MDELNIVNECLICFKEISTKYGFPACIENHFFCLGCVRLLRFKCPLDLRISENICKIINGEIILLGNHVLHLKMESDGKRSILSEFIKMCRVQEKYLTLMAEELDMIFSQFEKKGIKNKLGRLSWDSSYGNIYIGKHKDIDSLAEDSICVYESFEIDLEGFKTLSYTRQWVDIYVILNNYTKVLSSRFLRKALENFMKFHAISIDYFQGNQFNYLFPSLETDQTKHCLVCHCKVDAIDHIEFSGCRHKICKACCREMNNGHLICPIDRGEYDNKFVNDGLLINADDENANNENADIKNSIMKQKQRIWNFYMRDNDYISRCTTNNQRDIEIEEQNQDFKYVQEVYDEFFYNDVFRELEELFEKYHYDLFMDEKMMERFLNNSVLLQSLHHRNRMLLTFDYDNEFFKLPESSWFRQPEEYFNRL